MQSATCNVPPWRLNRNLATLLHDAPSSSHLSCCWSRIQRQGLSAAVKKSSWHCCHSRIGKNVKKSFLMTWQDTEHIRQPHPPCSQQPTTMSNQPQQETRSKRLREKANGTINGEDSSLTDSKKRPRGDDSNAVEKTRNQGVCRIFVRFLDTQREWVRNCTSCRL
jgi:hypothetical protein